MAAEKNMLRSVWESVYEHRDADAESARKFIKDFHRIYTSSPEVREFVNADVHLLSTLYDISRRAGLREYANEFRERFYATALDDVRSEGEIRYPLYLTFVMSAFENPSEKLEEMLGHLKPVDKNLIILDLVLRNPGNNQNAREVLLRNYRSLKAKKLVRTLLGRKLGSYVERLL